MKTFAGEDEAKKIKPIDIAVTYVPQARQEKIKQMKANPEATEFSYKNMCFKIAYTLDIGK